MTSHSEQAQLPSKERSLLKALHDIALYQGHYASDKNPTVRGLKKIAVDAIDAFHEPPTSHETSEPRQNVEVRFDTSRRPNEICMRSGSVHLERLDARRFCLILETDQSRSQFSLYSKSRFLALDIVEVNMSPPAQKAGGGA